MDRNSRVAMHRTPHYAGRANGPAVLQSSPKCALTWANLRNFPGSPGILRAHKRWGPDSQRRQATVKPGQVPTERHRATSSDARNVTGGQGVAGSNPAVLTGNQTPSDALEVAGRS